MVEKPQPEDVPQPPEPPPEPESCDTPPIPPEPPDDGIPDPHPALPYGQARSEMLKDMTAEQRIDFWQSETEDQQTAVNSWHVERFGVSPLP